MRLIEETAEEGCAAASLIQRLKYDGLVVGSSEGTIL
jgi:hypothetical protein